MKTLQKIIWDILLILACLVVIFGFLYIKVYTETIEPSLPGKILISEVMVSGGPGRSTDEYVELYNPGEQAISLGAWSVAKLTKSASSTDYQTIISLPEDVILLSHSYLLLSHVDSHASSMAGYQYGGLSIADHNTVVLRDAVGEVVDLVGFGEAVNSEGGPAEAPTAQLLSLERKPGGVLGNGQDTNQNVVDFFRTQPSPQNIFLITTSTPILEAPTSSFGMVTTSNSEVLEPEQIVEPTTTQPTYPPMGSVLITEVYPTPRSGEAEFVEIFNRTPERIRLDHWFISDGSEAKTILSGELDSLNYLVIEKPKGSLNNSGDIVKLVNPLGTVIDQIAYGLWDDLTPGNNAPSTETGQSLIRVHDSEDSNLDYFDFAVSVSSTKGIKNYLVSPESIEEVEAEISVSDKTKSSESVIEKVITKKPEPLYVRVIYQATSTVGTEIYFDASLSSGGSGLKQYVWEMDDGTILKGELIKHVYLEPGTYAVVVTAVDETGTEKHKTVKIKIGSVIDNEQVGNVSKAGGVKVAAVESKRAESVPVFTQIQELQKTKTNSLVRVRGVFAAVLSNKTGFDYYLVAESSTAGSIVGTLVKTKDATVDARIGDVVEITGKYITNQTTGNYIQFGASDTISIVRSGEIFLPVSSTIKNVSVLSGGFVQIQGKIVEKKSGQITVADNTGEVKIMVDSSEMYELNRQVLVTGFVVKTKTGTHIRLVTDQDLVVKTVVADQTQPGLTVQTSKRKNVGWWIVFLMILLVVVLIIKKKSNTDETEN